MTGLLRLAASEPRRTTLRTEVIEGEAPRVLTLGQEALSALRAIADSVSGVQERLAPDGYAVVGDLVVDGQRFGSEAKC